MENRLSLFPRLVGLLLLGLFAHWLLFQDIGPAFSGWTVKPPPLEPQSSLGMQVANVGSQSFETRTTQFDLPLEQRVEYWKHSLGEDGREAKVFRQGKKQVWLWSPSGPRGVYLEGNKKGTIEHLFRSIPKSRGFDKMEEFLEPPWSTLEFSSSGVGSPQRHLRIYNSKGGGGILKEHYQKTLKQEGWTALEREGKIMVYQKNSSRLWIQITPDGPESSLTLLYIP